MTQFGPPAGKSGSTRRVRRRDKTGDGSTRDVSRHDRAQSSATPRSRGAGTPRSRGADVPEEMDVTAAMAVVEAELRKLTAKLEDPSIRKHDVDGHPDFEKLKAEIEALSEEIQENQGLIEKLQRDPELLAIAARNDDEPGNDAASDAAVERRLADMGASVGAPVAGMALGERETRVAALKKALAGIPRERERQSKTAPPPAERPRSGRADGDRRRSRTAEGRAVDERPRPRDQRDQRDGRDGDDRRRRPRARDGDRGERRREQRRAWGVEESKEVW